MGLIFNIKKAIIAKELASAEKVAAKQKAFVTKLAKEDRELDALRKRIAKAKKLKLTPAEKRALELRRKKVLKKRAEFRKQAKRTVKIAKEGLKEFRKGRAQLKSFLKKRDIKGAAARRKITKKRPTRRSKR